MLRGGNKPQDSPGAGIDSLNGAVQNPVGGKNVAGTDGMAELNPLPQDTISDPITICPRDYFAHLTFSDSGTTIRLTDKVITQGFPAEYLRSANEIRLKQYYTLKEKLRDGKSYSGNTLYSDWIIGVVFISALLISIIRSEGGNTFKNLFRLFNLTGQNNKQARDLNIIFTWQSTVINFAAFLNIALFGYFMQRNYQVFPVQFPQFLILSGIFIVIVSAITARHFICLLTGNMSGQEDLFREYMFSVYQGYRLLGLFCFLIVVIISYTSFLPVEICFTTGIIAAIILYVLRIIKLLIIFIKRHISIFYYILYLCALEILPAVVLLRIVTGFK